MHRSVLLYLRRQMRRELYPIYTYIQSSNIVSYMPYIFVTALSDVSANIKATSFIEEHTYYHPIVLGIHRSNVS